MTPQQKIKLAGGEYIGEQLGGKTRMYWYNDPQTHTSMLARESDSVEDIKGNMEDRRRKFRR